MSIMANVYVDVYGNITIQMEGILDYEISSPFRKELTSFLVSYPTSTLTLDFQCVEFVGSSGINIFVETVNQLNKSYNQRLKLINVRSEFVKIFKLYQLENIGENLLAQDRDKHKGDASKGHNNELQHDHSEP